MDRTRFIEQLAQYGWQESFGKGSRVNVREFIHTRFGQDLLLVWLADDEVDEGTVLARLSAGDVVLQKESFRPDEAEVGLIFTVYNQVSDDVILADLLGRGYR